MKRSILCAIPALALAFVSQASAHPGHGHSESVNSLQHFVFEPIHALPLIGCILLLLLAIITCLRNRGAAFRQR